MTTLRPVSLAQAPADLAVELGASFEEYGFAVVNDHGIPTEIIAVADTAMRAFFALPDGVKRAYHVQGQGGARGYTPFGIETAKGAALHDLKEFWHVGRTLDAASDLRAFMPDNLWPEEVPQFKPAFTALYAEFDRAGAQILSAIALYLGLGSDFFSEAIADGNSVLRLLHYPPVRHPEPGAIRAAAHEDINAITLLLGAQEAGLELLTRAGEWVPVAPPPGALVVNIGDMLQRQTAGRLPSTTHRVVNPQGEAAARARYSLPFFLHFRPDYWIHPLGEGGEEPITANDFLQQRLREIRLA